MALSLQEIRSLNWLRRPIAVLSLACVTATGCVSYNRPHETIANDTSEIDAIVASIDHLEPDGAIADPMAEPVTPNKLKDTNAPLEYWNLTLDEAIRHGMSHSKVFRDLNGAILRSPDALQTTYTKGLQITDPRFGMDAVLSEFDTQFETTVFFEQNDRDFNNAFFSGGTATLEQNTQDYLIGLSKRTATGAEVAFRTLADWDWNNAPGNTFESAWNTQVEFEMRQPLLQGGGLTFNRIAGPNATEGALNGVLIARTNADIVQEDFEIGVRDYVSNVCNAYWDLYFAYRDLEAKRDALEKARETWQIFQEQVDQDRISADREALAREQYFRFKADFEDAQNGKLAQRTFNRNGSTGGVLRGISGVQVAERRLRLLIGLPITDNRTLRPAEEPLLAKVEFNWESAINEALARRTELRKQRLRVKRREMELLASKNFLSPRLDLVGQYRFRGFGNELVELKDGPGRNGQNDSALDDLSSAENQEWQFGVEFSMPIGFRRAHSAVHNAELQLARERAILEQQEREVIHDLSNVYGEVERAYNVTQTNLNRYLAAKELLESLEANQGEGRKVDLDKILDAQRRVADAQNRYFLSRVEYTIALKNMHFEKGSLFQYTNIHILGEVANQVQTAEGTTEAVDEATEPGKAVPEIEDTAPPVPELEINPTQPKEAPELEKAVETSAEFVPPAKEEAVVKPVSQSKPVAAESQAEEFPAAPVVEQPSAFPEEKKEAPKPQPEAKKPAIELKPDPSPSHIPDEDDLLRELLGG